MLYTNAEIAAEYLASLTFLKKKPRTQTDYRRWLNRFVEEFDPDDIAMWEAPASKRDLNKWREAWMHSPKQYDYCGILVTFFLNWAADNGYLVSKACRGLEKLYEVDRADIV
ncbi:MAG: hypothetical protein ABJR46_08810 [Tateyamaria sp.]|uniref:hypothetical protein n=1 Tax=Tateyamaria sp. TaxID=1929288 RepID=UPI00329C127B